MVTHFLFCSSHFKKKLLTVLRSPIARKCVMCRDETGIMIV
jgi:hypothetical protein